MMDMSNGTCFMSHFYIRGKQGRYDIIELLIEQNIDHRLGSFSIHGLAICDLFKDQRKVMSGGGIDQSLFKGLIIFNSPQHLYVFCAQSPHILCDILCTHLLYDKVSREIAAYDDHLIKQGTD